MDLTNALCPNCRKVVVFVREGNFNRCPECGTTYRLSPEWRGNQPRANNPSGVTLGRFFGLLFKTLLIMVAVLVVGVSVLFAGCLVLLSHH